MDPVSIIIVVAVVLVAAAGFLFLRGRSKADSTEIVRDSVRQKEKLQERTTDAPAATKTKTQAPAKPKAPTPPAGLRDRLGKSRQALAGKLAAVFGSSELDAEFWTDLEDTLVAADLGVATTEEVVAQIKATNPQDGHAAKAALHDRLNALLAGKDRALNVGSSPSVLLVVGVNGTGKTTSIAKIASQLTRDGESIVLGAADTFRAAAGDQLKEWGSRIDVPVVGGQEGADPASVAFDAFHAAKTANADRVIVDTAGRLHSKANLMDELDKVARVLRREAGEIDEVLLVIDGTTGQNAVDQARTFTQMVGVTGIVITKLDGTSRGGMAIAVEKELDIPVKYIGVGEGVDDLLVFDPEAFVDALLG